MKNRDELVVDANIINMMLRPPQPGAQSANSTPLQNIKASIETKYYLAVDNSGKIHNQYTSVCNKIYNEWEIVLYRSDRIRKYHISQNMRRKKALIRLGFGRTDKTDFIYVELSTLESNRMLITDDFEFWEPTGRCWPPAIKMKYKTTGKGKVSKYLKGENIEVREPTDASARL